MSVVKHQSHGVRDKVCLFRHRNPGPMIRAHPHVEGVTACGGGGGGGGLSILRLSFPVCGRTSLGNSSDRKHWHAVGAQFRWDTRWGLRRALEDAHR